MLFMFYVDFGYAVVAMVDVAVSYLFMSLSDGSGKAEEMMVVYLNALESMRKCFEDRTVFAVFCDTSFLRGRLTRVRMPVRKKAG